MPPMHPRAAGVVHCCCPLQRVQQRLGPPVSCSARHARSRSPWYFLRVHSVQADSRYAPAQLRPGNWSYPRPRCDAVFFLRRNGLPRCFSERHAGPAMPEAPVDVLLTSHTDGTVGLEVADDSEQVWDWRDELSELASNLQRCSPCAPSQPSQPVCTVSAGACIVVTCLLVLGVWTSVACCAVRTRGGLATSTGMQRP